jgi:hypothetical protein
MANMTAEQRATAALAVGSTMLLRGTTTPPREESTLSVVWKWAGSLVGFTSKLIW